MGLFNGNGNLFSTSNSAGGNSAASAGTPAVTGSALNNPNNLRIIGTNLGVVTGVGGSTAGTDISCTGRKIYTTYGAISKLKFLLLNNGNNGSAGSEGGGGYNPIICRASLEYPLGTAVQQMVVNGQDTWVMSPDNGVGVFTDLTGAPIPAGTQFAAEVYKRVAAPPTSPAASLTTGGTLVNGTTYYYFISSIDVVGGIESGPATSVNVAATITNNAAILTWVRNANATSYRIYRSTTNTASTALLIAQVSDPIQTYTDTGAITPFTGVAPKSAQRFSFNAPLQPGDSSNRINSGGTGADATGSTGILAITTSLNSSFADFLPCPNAILADDLSSPSVIACGDSREAGVGSNSTNATAKNIVVSSYFNIGMATAGLSNNLQFSVGGSTIQQFTTNNPSVALRLALSGYANYFQTNCGRNDIYNSATWQNTALYHLALAKSLYDVGVRYCLETIFPNVATTDMGRTIGGQTPTAPTNAVRINFNNWIRNGCQVSAGTPVLSGGTSSPYIYGYFEAANVIEANSSNVLTQDGGYFLAPASAAATGALTGTPTTTALSTSLAMTLNQYCTYVFRMTSGAASGQIGLVSSNNTTAFALYANGASSPSGVGTLLGLTTSPAAGDTFDLWRVYSCEGVHPSYACSVDLGAAFATFATRTFVPF